MQEEKKERVDIDQLTKRLIELFFKEFFEFFYPELIEVIDFNSVDYLNPELYSGKVEGEKTISDVLAKVNLKNGLEQYVLIHLEVQSSKDKDIARRMYRYFSNIWMKYEKPVFALALFMDEAKWRKPISNVFSVEFMGTKLTYEFNIKKTKTYDYHKYLDHNNPITTALLVRMNFGRESRAKVKAEAMKRIKQYHNLTEEQAESLLHFIDRLLFLNEKETKKFKEIIQQEQYEEVKEMLTTLQEEILLEERKKEKLEIAKKSLEEGFAEEVISRITGLSLEEIQKIKLN